ncbi:MAG: hypothetical protein GWP37_07575 [Gammaproteobacteria bacterium]|jgi:uncharacterized membrane protein YccC|nr:hypothetical protein [Gammaproteobacteria bacterium]
MAVENMADASTPLWLIASFIGLWLGFRLSHSMHEGAADSRAPNTARALVTAYCLSVSLILIEVGFNDSVPRIIQVSCLLIAAATAIMQLLQIWTDKPSPGKDCQGRETVE